MTATRAIRDRKHSSDRHLPQRQMSGEQYVLPLDEPNENLHCLQPVSREDMEKLKPSAPDPDDPVSP